MALKDNSPTLSYISWKDLIITYVGQTYNIQNSHTNMKYIYWDITNPYTLQCYNRIQPQSPGMYQLFINDNGMATQRSHDGLVLSWDGNNADLIAGQIFAIHEANKEIGNRFVAIETDIDGIKQTVGNTKTEVDKISENVSQIKQQADNIDLTVQSLVREYDSDKETSELRENLNKSMIDFNSSIGVLKSEMYGYYRDNRINSEELIMINTSLDIIVNKKTEVIKYVDIVIVMMETEGQTTLVNRLNSAKTKFTNSVDNLYTYISTAISDGTTVPSEITGMTDLFAKCNTSINELKNVCDDCIFLGAGGTIIEALAKIGIKSDEIILSVSKTEEDIKNNLGVEKSLLQGNITDLRNAANKLAEIIESTFKDGSVSTEEKEIVNEYVVKLDKEKDDIVNKFEEFNSSGNLSSELKDNLVSSHSEFNKSYTDMVTKINEVMSDGFTNDAEKAQVVAAINTMLSGITRLHPYMTQAIDDIQMNEYRAEIQKAKEELQKEITEIDNVVGELGGYIDGTFENNILDETERISIKTNLENLEREKVDIDNQYTQLSSNDLLTGTLKFDYDNSYNDIVSKITDIKNIIENILSKEDLINDNDRSNIENANKSLNESLGNFTKLSNEVIEFIAKSESESIKELLDKEISELDEKVEVLNSDINGTFKNNILDESERNAISLNLKDLELQKNDIDGQYSQLILSIYLEEGILKSELDDKYNSFKEKYNNLILITEGILTKPTLIEESDRVNLDNAKESLGLSLKDLSIVINKVIEHIGKKQSDAAIGDFSKQLSDLSDKVDNIMGDIGGALADDIIDDAERIIISQNLENLKLDFSKNETEYLKIYNDTNLTGIAKSELNDSYNVYSTKYTNVVNTINAILNKIGSITDVERDALENTYEEYRDATKLYLDKLYNAMNHITNTSIELTKNELNKEIEDITNSINNLEETMTGVFKDGILSDAEKLSIKQHLQALLIEKSDIDKTYDTIYNNNKLEGSFKSDLSLTYERYVTSYNSLVDVINTILNKEEILDSSDESELNTAFNNHKTALGEFKIKYNNAVDSITNVKIDGLKNQLQSEINDLNKEITGLEDTMNNAFKDGILSDAEKLSIKQHLQTIGTEKGDIDSQYTTVYSNEDLEGTAKDNLKSAYDTYISKYTSLVTIINGILEKDGIVDSTDKLNLDNGFDEYKAASSSYSQRINEAIDNIAKKKADTSESNSKTYTNSQIKILSDSINLTVEQQKTDIEKLDKEVTNIDSKVSSIDINLESITSRVSTVEEKANSVEGTIQDYEKRISEAEQKISADGIIGIVKNATEVNGEVTFARQSTVSQLANSWTAQFKEGYKEGYTDISAKGIKIASNRANCCTRINDEFFSIYDGGEAVENRKSFIGMRHINNAVYAPSMVLGYNGVDPYSESFGGTHLTFTHYPQSNNPEANSKSYGSMAFKTTSNGAFTAINMYSDGEIKIKPNTELNITKNTKIEGEMQSTRVVTDSIKIREYDDFKPDDLTFSTPGKIQAYKVYSTNDIVTNTTVKSPKFETRETANTDNVTINTKGKINCYKLASTNAVTASAFTTSASYNTDTVTISTKGKIDCYKLSANGNSWIGGSLTVTGSITSYSSNEVGEAYVVDIVEEIENTKSIQKSHSKEIENISTETELNTNEINDVIIPYCLDLDYQVSRINSSLSNLTPQNKMSLNNGGNLVTYKIFKKQILNKKLELLKALDMIEVFSNDNKLTVEEVEELVDLAYSYLI